MNPEAFLALRALLCEPSRDSWEAILTLLQGWPTAEDLDNAIHYAAEHIEAWDPQFCPTFVPGHQRFFEDPQHPISLQRYVRRT